jgi:tetratricopeptide (TPR) repeat protein|uniref:Tetratricopeptide repeat protein n=1 Tax=Desulfomonile tiedjei TaxID=2358 RepID=A0A7C4AS25_9BACT
MAKWKLKFLVLTCLFFLASNVWAEESDATSLFQIGRRLFETGDYYRAVETFSKILQAAEPDTPAVHLVRLARAQAYYGKGDLKRAWADLNAVLESGAVNGEILASGLMLRGTINLKEGRQKSAFNDFTKAINIDHANKSLKCLALTNRGIAYVNRGDLENAIRDLNRAVSIDPTSSFAYAARGLAHLRSDKIDLARRDSEKALSLSPDPSAAKIAQKILSELSVTQSSANRLALRLNEHGQIFVQVKFGRTGAPHRFLLDTGATHTVISPKLLAEISRETKVTPLGKGMVVLADGSSQSVSRYRVNNAFLFNMPLGDIEVHVFDRKTKAGLNLLGAKSLGNVTVTIDSGAKRAEIARK